jgi:hypothetical protein
MLGTLEFRGAVVGLVVGCVVAVPSVGAAAAKP